MTTRVRQWRTAALAACVIVATACASGTPQLQVVNAQAAVPVAGSSQVVVQIVNDGDGDDALVGASTPRAAAVEIHITEIADQRATMRKLDRVDLPAGDTVHFQPGGLHLMLVVPDPDLQLGDVLPITFVFANTDDVTVDVEIVDQLDLFDAAIAGTTP